MTSAEHYFDLSRTGLAPLFQGLEHVWEVLDRIKPFIREAIRPNVGPVRDRFGDFLPQTVVLYQDRLWTEGFELEPGDTTKGKFGVKIEGRQTPGAVVIYGGACLASDQVELQAGVVVEPGAMIKGPTIIGPQTEVRQSAYLRGSVLTGRSCVVGHATEVKNGVFLDDAKAGHFAYVGDSVLGINVNLGAGTKLANLKIKETPFRFKVGDEVITVKRRKFGAIIGDKAELGCNTVTNPGSLIGPGCLVPPNTSVPAGIHKARSVIRSK